MKRKLLYVVFVGALMGISCNKNSDVRLAVISVRDILNERHRNSGILKVDENIARELAVVDATAAALAYATIGKVPVAGAYLALWAGFAASRQAEPTIRKTYEQKLVGPEDQQPDRFTKGYIGAAHNDLMVEASAKNIPVIISDHKFNASLKELLLEHDYFGLYDNLGKLYTDYEASITGIVAYTARYIRDDGVNIGGMVQDQADFSPVVKARLTGICNSIYELNGKDIMTYLKNMDGTVKISNELNADEKECILCFIGVLQSSLSLWQSNS